MCGILRRSEEDVIGARAKLTSKDDKYACAFADKIVYEFDGGK